MLSALDRRIAESRERFYTLLRERDPERYRRAIDAAQCVILNHRLEGRAAVDTEAAVVLAVCDALNLKPEYIPDGN